MIGNLSSRPLAFAAALALFAGAAILMVMAPLASAELGGPTVTLSSTASSTTNAPSMTITATFSEDVSGFDASDIVAASSTVSDFASTSGSVYTFTLTPTAEGQVTVTVPADVASSTASTTLGNQSSNTLTFTSDTTAATVLNVVVGGITSSEAGITASTSEPSTVTVMYGTTASYGSTTAATTLGTSHTVALSGLSASTTYHYQVQATDEAGNATTTSDGTFTTAAAPLAPAISDIAVSSVGSTTATITWSTDLPASSQVSYGTSTGYGSTSTYDATASTSHSVVLSGLSEGTTYHFAVMSGNTVGTSTSADQSFITQSTASSTPLAVVSVTPVSTIATADGTFQNGWSWVMRLTVPDNEDAFRMKFSDWSGSAGTFAGDNNVRISSPQSSNASTTASGIIAPDNNYGTWMYLTGDASTSTPGRQIDVTIEVRIPSGTAAGSYTTTFGANSTPQAATSTTP